MKKKSSELMISASDYDILNNYIRKHSEVKSDRVFVEMLQKELKQARVVEDKELPANVVRLNSKVKIQEGTQGKPVEVKVVLPEHADIRSRFISIFAPLATALFGYKEGATVTWQVPAGKKAFKILEVCNSLQA